MAPRMKFFSIVLALTLLLFALDRLVFGYWIFLPDNYTSWDSYRWYNFAYHLRRLERSRRESPVQDEKRRPLVVVVGSSIAKYSVQKEVLEKAIQQRSGQDVRVEMVVHAAMLPVDLENYLPRIAALEPDLIVYITNPADMDLERFVPPWEVGPEYRYSHRGSLHYLEDRIPALMYYPVSFVSGFYSRLSMEKSISMVGGGLLNSIRFRDHWWDPLLFNMKSSRPERAEKIKSYHNYTGTELQPGLWKDGRVGACVVIPGQAVADREAIYAEVPGELMVPGFQVEFFTVSTDPLQPPDEQNVSPECERPRSFLEQQVFQPDASGWQDIPIPPVLEKQSLYVLVSHTVNDAVVREAGEGSDVYSGRSLRLPAHFGLDEPEVGAYLKRYPELEDLRIAELKLDDYPGYYTEKVEPEDWRSPVNRALWQMNGLRMGKYYVNWYGFDRNADQVQALQRIFARVSRNTSDSEKYPASLLVINNPENPLTLWSYRKSDWYGGYLEFYQEQQKRYPHRVLFADLSLSGTEQMFLDPHHLTYNGMLDMAPVYAWLIEDALRGRTNK